MPDRIEKLKIFLQQSPDDCFLNHALGLEYVKLGQDEEARLVFEKNLQTDPTYVASYYHLGKLFERMGTNDKAIVVYEQGMDAAKTAGDMHTYNELQAAHEDVV